MQLVKGLSLFNRFSIRKIAFLLLTLFFGLQAQALEYQLTTSLTEPQTAAVTTLLQKAQSLLPELIKSNLSVVKIKVEKIAAPSGEALGLTDSSTHTITLDKSLLKAIVAGPFLSEQINRTHKTAYEEALATVLHETTHMYDFANLHSAEEYEWMSRCSSDKDIYGHRQTPAFACRYYKKMNTSFSGNPYFLQVAGWGDKSDNGFTERSPDIYELTNPKEYLAVNMEYFLLDPDYKCRRPSMYRLLSSSFKHIPFADISCEAKMGYVIPNSSYKMAQILNIDPSRVYQIHYLFAEKGSELMSGWGHSMIRLVICSPDRKVVGPDCLRDVESHVVLSFRAFVDSLATSTWAGLSGKYPARLFILPMSQVIDEYTKDQFRALRSLPLNLSREQINEVIARSMELHWDYEGKYYFVSNNCATETLNLLQSSLMSPDLLFTDITTPIGLYKELVKKQSAKPSLADESVLKDRKQSIELGFYFESYEARFNKAYEIASSGVSMPTKNFREWILVPAETRQKVIQSVDRTKPDSLKVTAALFILELAAQRKVQAFILTDLQHMMTQAVSDKKDGQASQGQQGAIADNFLELSQLFAKASSFLVKGQGYGLPMPVELAQASALINKEADEAEQTRKETQKMTDDLTSKELLDQMETVNTNLELLKKLLNGN